MLGPRQLAPRLRVCYFIKSTRGKRGWIEQSREVPGSRLPERAGSTGVGVRAEASHEQLIVKRSLMYKMVDTRILNTVSGWIFTGKAGIFHAHAPTSHLEIGKKDVKAIPTECAT